MWKLLRLFMWQPSRESSLHPAQEQELAVAKTRLTEVEQRAQQKAKVWQSQNQQTAVNRF